MKRQATLRVWTPDYGKVLLHLDRDEERIAYFLQETLDLGLFAQLRRFPVGLVARLLPRLTLSSYRRRLVEIWIEETGAKTTA